MKRKSSAAACAAALPVLLFAASALAGDGTPPSQQAGLLVLPNVKVQYANAAQREIAASVTPLSGMRAFKDRETGQLRGATPEEMVEMGNEGPPSPSARARAKAQPSRVLSNGTRAATLGAAGLSYSVVARDAAGNLEAACARNEDTVQKVLSGQAIAKEDRHAD